MNTQPEQPAGKTNWMAIASLILGILGLLGLIIIGILIPFLIDAKSCKHYSYGCSDEIVFFWVPMLFLTAIAESILGLTGLTTGILALWLIKKKAKYQKRKAMASAGIVLGILNCITGLFVALVILYFTGLLSL